MSTHTVSKKRKSVDGALATTKKVKLSTSAEKPAPLKSALKKPRVETTAAAVQEKDSKPKAGSRDNKKATKTKKPKADDLNTSVQTNTTDVNGTSADLSASEAAALFAGFSSSEDEVEAEDEEAGIQVSKLPKAPTAGLIQKRIRQAVDEQGDPESTPGVIYLGRIPHGFYERQMTAYFSQFGEITRLRLARNKRTGSSQHYAFVEFASAAVADIVAKTMDKYLLFNHILQCRRIPQEQVQEGMWKGAGRRKKPAPLNRLEGNKLKRGATRDVWEARVEKENQKRAEKAEKMKELGYEFDAPVVKDVSEVPVKPRELEQGEKNAKIEEIGQTMAGVEELQSDSVAAPKADDAATKIVEETTVTTKKRSASGKPGAKKVVKKVKAT